VNEKTIFLIAIISSLVGIVAILILPFVFEIKVMEISEITEDLVGEKVSVSGIVEIKVNKDTISIIEVNDGSGKIEAVFFEKIFFEGEEAKITGTVDKYNGKLQIKAENIQ